MKNHVKGQAISIDYIIAILVFLGLVALILYLLNIVPTGQQIALQQRANTVADFLTAQFQDCNKLRNLTQQSYKSVKSKLNIDPYDFYVEVQNFNASLCGDMRPKLDTIIIFDQSSALSGQALADEKLGAYT